MVLQEESNSSPFMADSGLEKKLPGNMHESSEDIESVPISKHEKPFSILSAIGLGYSITNTSTGLILTFGTTLPFGGSPLFFFGFLVMTAIAFCIALSLGEMSSAWPHSGGQYFWTSRLAPEKGRRFLSYVTAIISWTSVICISVSCALIAAELWLSIISFVVPLDVKPWMTFLVYQAVNIGIFGFNCFESLLAIMGRFLMGLTIVTSVVVFIALFAAGGPIVSASEFFTDFTNTSGWPDGIAFFIGINGINWCFSCLDAATHLADEIPNPAKNIPRCLMWTVGISAVSGMPVILAMFLTLNKVTDTDSLSLFYNVLHQNTRAAIAIQSLVLASAMSSLVGIHTWQARIAWALGRDKGLPFHKFLSKVAPAPFSAPLWAHLWSASFTALCGCIYLGSRTAFSSFIAAGIILQYATYCLPIALMWWRGRATIKHGPFWFPRLGPVANAVTFTWFAIILVVYCLPFYLPVVANEMNYVSAVLVVIFGWALLYWVLYGRKNYKCD
ncbi:amino acid/polyamine transporter I [Penicillium robsamsonii]|uniref:amino acid/polyamine transporter I n=1 Tax=Penicillium robsamsonii TaxID=1792511 RepID=UPI0025495C68|nr:amino acid/polyamine transporter I [Penicillium robsamsonii]KAJ5817023.1 amino acid/polyamine transporter I [Penicillium robsamsonii]